MHKNNRSSKNLIFLHLASRFPLRFIVFFLLWYVLTGSDNASWIIGVPAVLFATALSLMLAPSYQCRISLIGTFCFILFFLRQSFHGGIDVMRRALSSRQLLDPGLVSYTTLLPEGSARIFFVNTISLLPGTLSADLHGNQVTIHTLDRGLPIWANIQGLEYHVAALMRTSSEKIVKT